MKRPNYGLFGVLWTVAAVASFRMYLQTVDSGALVRAGIFLLFGILYFYLNRTRKK